MLLFRWNYIKKHMAHKMCFLNKKTQYKANVFLHHPSAFRKHLSNNNSFQDTPPHVLSTLTVGFVQLIPHACPPIYNRQYHAYTIYVYSIVMYIYIFFICPPNAASHSKSCIIPVLYTFRAFPHWPPLPLTSLTTIMSIFFSEGNVSPLLQKQYYTK